MRLIIIVLLCGAVALGWKAGAPTAERSPPQPVVATGRASYGPRAGTLVLDRGRGGHFFVTGDVAGTPLRFLVDTGAYSVAIGREDARKLGMLPDRFDHTLSTAGGKIRGAEIILPRVAIGDIRLTDVAAVVIDTEETMPLLGQSFLGRLDRVSIERDRMTLAKD